MSEEDREKVVKKGVETARHEQRDVTPEDVLAIVKQVLTESTLPKSTLGRAVLAGKEQIRSVWMDQTLRMIKVRAAKGAAPAVPQ